VNEQLAKALVAAINDMPVIGKDAQGQRSQYVSLDALLAGIKPVFKQHGLTIMQWPVTPSQAGNVAIETIVLHESGEMMYRMGELPIGTNNPGMNASQAAGAAYTYLRRYQLAAICGVVSDEDIDSLPEPAPKQAPPKRQPVAKRQPPPPMPGPDLNDDLNVPRVWLANQAKEGRVSVGDLNTALRDSSLYKNITHALNAVKLYPHYPDDYDTDAINGGTEFKTESALAVYDWAISRKSEHLQWSEAQ
jgi:hypothetical protein